MGQHASCARECGQETTTKHITADEQPLRDIGASDLSAKTREALTIEDGETMDIDNMMQGQLNGLLDENDLDGGEEEPPSREKLKIWLSHCENGEAVLKDLEENAPALSEAAENIGDHVCPKIGDEAVDEFLAKDRLHKILAASKEDMGKNFALDAKSSKDTGDDANQAYGIAMAVSDPNAEDCPLVFVSSGFEDLTGYPSKFVTGRSCRFLQPTSKVLNDGINLNDRKLMRHFSTEIQPVGSMIVNLLLNERQTGERFWNLLRMQYVSVDGKEYIFAVQTTLEAFMPKLLKKRINGYSKNTGIVESLGPFIHALEKMREEIRNAEFTPIMELKGYYTCALNMLQMLPALTKLNGATGSNLLVAGGPGGPGGPSPGASKSSAEVASKEEKLALAPGCIVTVDPEMKYPTYKVAAKTKGKVLTIDGSGTVSIEWDGIGKKGCLRRDVAKLIVVSAAP